MAITTFIELKTAIADWLNRSDLTSAIPDFIAIAEAQMYRGPVDPRGITDQSGLRLVKMEERNTWSTVASQEHYNLQSDFLEMRNLSYVRSGTTYNLVYRTPSQLDSHYSFDTTSYPEAFSIEGNDIRLRPIPSSVWTITQTYYKRFDALSDANPTNDILTDHPDIYLFGSLAASEAYTKNDARIALWRDQFITAILAANRMDERARRKGGVKQAVSSQHGHGRRISHGMYRA